MYSQLARVTLYNDLENDPILMTPALTAISLMDLRKRSAGYRRFI